MKTSKKKTKRNPTPAQLRARRAFVKMVRERAKGRKRGNPGEKHLSGATAKQQRQYEEIKRAERKQGVPLKKAKSIAAATVRARAKTRRRNSEKRDSDHPIEVTRHYRAGPPGYLTPWQRAHAMGQRQLFETGIKPATPRKRNASKAALKQRERKNAEWRQRVVNYVVKLRAQGYPDNKIAEGAAARYGALIKINSDHVIFHGQGNTKQRVDLPASNPKRRNKTIIKARTIKHLDISRIPNRSTKRRINPGDRAKLATLNQIIRTFKRRILQSKNESERRFLRQQMIEFRGEKFALEQKLAGSSRRNPGVTAKTKETRKMFTGKKTRRVSTMNAATGTPRSLAKLGRIVSIKTRSKTFKPPRSRRNPGEEVLLTADDRGHLHLVAEELPLVAQPLHDFGEILEIEYATAKPHLGYSTDTVFFHHLGEEGGARPHLVSDREGALKIAGGDYQITERGLED